MHARGSRIVYITKSNVALENSYYLFKKYLIRRNKGYLSTGPMDSH